MRLFKWRFDYRSSAEGVMSQAALPMRKFLKKVNSEYLSTNPITPSRLGKGEASPPDIVKTLFRILFGGPCSSKHSDEIHHRVDPASQEALFIVSKGIIRPQKHIALGVGVKSMTGSRKLAIILKRLGHSLN